MGAVATVVVTPVIVTVTIVTIAAVAAAVSASAVPSLALQPFHAKRLEILLPLCLPVRALAPPAVRRALGGLARN